MKIDNYKEPHSSFLAVEKDMEIIVNHFIANDRLMKMLYYSTPSALAQPDVPYNTRLEMFGKQIKIIPKLKVDKPEFCYIIISFDNFTQNRTNTAFRDNIITFDVICHFDQWSLGNYALRPYKIAAEIDSMFNHQKLTGIGILNFLGASQIILSDEFAGLTLMYESIHGYEGEDSKNALDPREQESIEENFNKLFNL